MNGMPMDGGNQMQFQQQMMFPGQVPGQFPPNSMEQQQQLQQLYGSNTNQQFNSPPPPSFEGGLNNSSVIPNMNLPTTNSGSAINFLHGQYQPPADLNATGNWPLLWLSILRFSDLLQFAEASEGFRFTFLSRKSDSFTVELWS